MMMFCRGVRQASHAAIGRQRKHKSVVDSEVHSLAWATVLLQEQDGSELAVWGLRHQPVAPTV